MEYLVRPDKRGEERLIEKVRGHLGKGVLHKAFSVFVFNSERDLLIQKRSGEKMLWPYYWSNTCCSHPRLNERIVSAGKRRLQEELGFSCDLKKLYDFKYCEEYREHEILIGTENELCSVLIGKSDELPKMNYQSVQDEICNYDYLNLEELSKSMENSENYTPWFKMEVAELIKNYMLEIDNLFKQ